MKLYTYSAINNYLSKLDNPDIIEIPGCLLDNYIINHSFCIEIIKEKVLNEWQSAAERHIFRKRVPKKYKEWLLYGLSADYDTDTKQNIADALMMIDSFNNK